MSSFSDTLENDLLNHIFAVSSKTKPANVYVAVATSSTGMEIHEVQWEKEVS